MNEEIRQMIIQVLGDIHHNITIENYDKISYLNDLLKQLKDLVEI